MKNLHDILRMPATFLLLAADTSCTVELTETGFTKRFEAELWANHKTHIAGVFTD